MDTSIRLNDRTALVTGATTSYGRAIALRLSEYGANVALADTNAKTGERLAEEIMNQREVHEKRGRAVFLGLPNLENKNIEDLAGRAAEAFGGVDIYIDTWSFAASTKLGTEFDIAKMDELIQANLRAPAILSQKVVPFFKARKRGRIIFLIPELARMGFADDALLALSRTGIEGFSRTLAKNFVQDPITINCLGVAPSEDYLLQKFPSAKSVQAAQEELLKNYGGFKTVEVTDVANVACFLASPLASSITGQTISASGGLYL
ncbi:MAG: SDR family NAD(P)-dependent oxidoreductase [Bdellovibrionales bacterium]